jgi:hypothetical protein
VNYPARAPGSLAAMSTVTRLASERRTEALGALALGATGALCAVELRHRGGIARIRAGYRAASTRENAVFNALAAFLATLGATRAITHLIRSGSGPFRNVTIGTQRIHHFVPGILISFLAGGLSIGLRHEELDKWLAVPFGGGVALVLDEAALLLELEDVYWSRKGVLSVQISLGAAALLACLGLVARLFGQGRSRELEPLAG